IDFQLGFRGEETISDGKQLANDSSFTRNYFNLFPSTFLNWAVDSSHTLNFSYSRRIDRPGYGELNPFLFIVSPVMYNAGNPFLHPQISDNFELTHVYKGILSVTLGYLHMTDVFMTFPHQDDSTHIFYNRTENFPTYNSASALGSVSWPVTSWFTTVTAVTVFYDHYFGSLTGGGFDRSQWTWIVNSDNIITLKRNWSAEVSLFYRSLNRNGIWLEQPLYGLNCGVRKNFAGGKGTVAVNFNDILWRTYVNGTAIYQDANTVVRGNFDSRRVYISFSWKFGRSQYQRDTTKKSGEDEMNRAK
ncbi:MAG TPA: outer membrane beta-barrel family protein, partial [Bacteroidia bacterium]|nr:outer membrane beta-barrel family protein [Bacteroidia bacterium]